MDVLSRLYNHLVDVPTHLAMYSAIELTQKAPGKWSRQEILGHLIDSALNNLKRFTEAQFSSVPYQVQFYDQNQLVVVNRYQDLPLDHLLTLWRSLNRQIVHVLETSPAETLAKPVSFSSSDSIDCTLQWLIDDYVNHLEHHLETLL